MICQKNTLDFIIDFRILKDVYIGCILHISFTLNFQINLIAFNWIWRCSTSVHRGRVHTSAPILTLMERICGSHTDQNYTFWGHRNMHFLTTTFPHYSRLFAVFRKCYKWWLNIDQLHRCLSAFKLVWFSGRIHLTGPINILGALPHRMLKTDLAAKKIK